MKTQGEIEAEICEGISRFEQEYMGRGPKYIDAHLVNDLLVVRLKGVLTAAEQQLVKSLPAEKGRDLVKQVRTHLDGSVRWQIKASLPNGTSHAFFTQSARTADGNASVGWFVGPGLGLRFSSCREAIPAGMLFQLGM